jgi:hypothetical protein
MDVVREKFGGNKDNKNNGEWLGSVEYLATRDLIGKSLAENDPFVQFLLEPMKFDDEEERIQTSRFLMGFPIDDSIRHGAVSLGYRPVGDSSNNKKKDEATSSQQPLTGCVLVREYDSAKEATKWKLLASMTSFLSSGRAYFRMSKLDGGIPPLCTSRKKRPYMYHFFNVAGAIQKKSVAWHHEYGPKENHWHVCQVGGESDEITKLVLERLCRIADEEQMEMFMGASGGHQVKLYEQVGFQLVAQEEFSDPVDDSRTITIGNLVRQPKPLEEAK